MSVSAILPRHSIRIGALTLLGLVAMFYPFMPGEYDRLASVLSGMAQLVGVSGILLMPIGLAWLAYELANRERGESALPSRPKSHRFAITALAALLLVGFALAMMSLHSSLSLVVITFALLLVGVGRAWPAVKRLKDKGSAGFNPAPLYLIIVPAVLAIARFAFMETAVEISRKRTILGAAQFITAIEHFRNRYGHYPTSLESTLHDYDPPTVGVERYRYELQGDAYNVFFEHPTWQIGMQEFVMYNPRGEHLIIVHNSDVLESPQAQVDAERRYHARSARDAGVTNWKYFWFD